MGLAPVPTVSEETLLSLRALWALPVLAVAAHASTTYTAVDSVAGQDATATFSLFTGTLTIVIDNLISNPAADSQNVSDVEFTLSNGATTGSLTSSTGTQLTVHANKTYTVGTTGTTDWSLTSSGGTFDLNALGVAHAPETVIGTSSTGNYTTGTYSNANPSITGSNHNPFLESGASFSISISGISASTIVNSAIISFGTAAGDNVDGVCTAGACPSGTVPEPYSLYLTGGGLALVGLLARRKLFAAR